MIQSQIDCFTSFHNPEAGIISAEAMILLSEQSYQRRVRQKSPRPHLQVKYTSAKINSEKTFPSPINPRASLFSHLHF